MKQKKLGIFIGAVVLIFIGNQIFGWSDDLADGRIFESLELLVEENLVLAAAVYMAVTVIGSVVLALPGITFAVLAGILFGPVLGTVCCCVAATLGAVAAFVAGRYFLRDSIRPVAMKNKYLKRWLFDESGKNQIFLLMITRLVPLFPYNLQNFAYGVTDIRFGTYTIGTFLFMIPGTAMYTVGAAGIAGGANRTLYLGIAVALAAVVTVLGVFFKKRYVEKETEETEKNNEN